MTPAPALAYPATPPLEAGAVVSATWRLYRANWRYLVAIAAVVFIPLGLAGAGLSLFGWPGVVSSVCLNLMAVFFVQGAVVRGVQNLRDRRLPGTGVAPVLSDSRRWIGDLTIVSILAALSVFAGLLLLIIPGLVLVTWWVVLSPVVVIERPGILASFRRSRALVLGHGWPVFGIAVLTMIIQLAFSLALGLAVLPLGSAMGDLIATILGTTLAAPFVAIAWTLTYLSLLELRTRAD